MVTLEFDLTSQSSGIWTHGFLTETETADKNENVTQYIYLSATITGCYYYYR